jgi:oligopeptide transport system substrate-binding protein
MDRIGIRLKVKKDKFPEMLKQGKQCAIPSWALGWTRSSEAEFVMKLLYSKTIGQNNYACLKMQNTTPILSNSSACQTAPERTRVLHKHVPFDGSEWRARIKFNRHCNEA